MQARIHRKVYELYAMDIESHNDPESIEKKETSMWLGCFINENSKPEDEESYFYTMDEFIQRCEKLCSKKLKTGQTRPCKNIAVYIYNLSFEWSFLLPVLLSKGFQFKGDIDKEDEYVYNSISTK